MAAPGASEPERRVEAANVGERLRLLEQLVSAVLGLEQRRLAARPSSGSSGTCSTRAARMT
jgi:hypothetical protein